MTTNQRMNLPKCGIQTTTLKDFKVVARLGEGSYSCVYRVMRLSDQQIYALKKVKMHQLSDKERENALNEVRILASIQHENIIGYKEAFFDEASNCLCIIMENADGGDISNKIKNHQDMKKLIPECDIWTCLIQTSQALKSLHKQNILHRDLKCANIFTTADGNIKLGDLNVSKIAKTGLVYTQTGTPYYASPEVWQDEPYDYKSDIWSLGCVIYEMASLKPPFRAKDMEGLFNKVIKGKYDKLPSLYSDDLSYIIQKCLQVDPKQRFSSDQILNDQRVQQYVPASTNYFKDLGSQSCDLLGTIQVKDFHKFDLIRGQIIIISY